MTPEAAQKQAGVFIRLRRSFAAPRENVFRAWTSPDALQRWWCPIGWTPSEVQVDLRVSGAYRIAMRKTENGLTVSVYGRFLEIHPPERLVYTWNWENAFPDMKETRVTVLFAESGAGTEVVLIHENFPEAGVCLRHRAGWIEAWNRMEACLEHRS